MESEMNKTSWGTCMTNTELQVAIESSWSRIRSVSAYEPEYDPAWGDFRRLVDEQARRATTRIIKDCK